MLLTVTYTYPVRRLYRKGPYRVATDKFTIYAPNLTEAYMDAARRISGIRWAVVTNCEIGKGPTDAS